MSLGVGARLGHYRVIRQTSANTTVRHKVQPRDGPRSGRRPILQGSTAALPFDIVRCPEDPTTIPRRLRRGRLPTAHYARPYSQRNSPSTVRRQLLAGTAVHAVVWCASLGQPPEHRRHAPAPPHSPLRELLVTRGLTPAGGMDGPDAYLQPVIVTRPLARQPVHPGVVPAGCHRPARGTDAARRTWPSPRESTLAARVFLGEEVRRFF